MLLTHEPLADEAALVRAAQMGDRAAFGALYRRFARMIHGIALAHAPYADAEDVMHDVFVRALEQLRDLRQPAAFGAWLAATARREAFGRYRRIRPVEPLSDSTPGGAQPDGEAFEVLGIIRSLPESYRETLVLRLVEGMTGPEIAARTGLTPKSVRVNLCRGMKLLRQRLEAPR